jgi:hypothetical protein
MPINFTFSGNLAGLISRAFYLYFETIDKFFKSKLRIQGDSQSLSFSFEMLDESENIDQRIKKIDLARENLIDGLKAIDELKKAAEHNKSELVVALEQLEKLKNYKKNEEKNLSEIKKIASIDLETFQKVAGIASKKEKTNERIIGFVFGIITSILATIIIYIFGYVIELFFV